MSKSFNQLVDIMTRLRSRRGCPWDREQTWETLKPFLIEESYEVIEAIDRNNPEDLKEELGDLLFQVLFHAQIAKEKRKFDIERVIQSVSEKMIRRHPHVFGTSKGGTAQQVLIKWEKIKVAEARNRKRRSVLEGVPNSLPSLLRAHQLQGRASRVGFDWSNMEPVFEKVLEELKELKDAIRRKKQRFIEEEFGDLLFSLVNLSRFLSLNSEEALRKANRRFSRRFYRMEQKARQAKTPLTDYSIREMNQMWEEAKRSEAKRSRGRKPKLPLRSDRAIIK